MDKNWFMPPPTPPGSGYQMAQKREMLRDRRQIGRINLCDYCGNKTTMLDKHEIVQRSRTVNGSDHRYASMHKHLSSILCRTCHEKAHRENLSVYLLRFNSSLYGLTVVESAFKALPEIVTQGIEVPEEFNG